MTRINMGIPVGELCDQHLVAEYRELPRMVGFARRSKGVWDMDFRLNTGHMKSCVRYGAYLAERHAHLIDEMKARGFNANLPPIHADSFPSGSRRYPSEAWMALAMQVIRPRIVDRIRTMKRKPTWTNRERPAWSRLQS